MILVASVSPQEPITVIGSWSPEIKGLDRIQQHYHAIHLSKPIVIFCGSGGSVNIKGLAEKKYINSLFERQREKISV